MGDYRKLIAWQEAREFAVEVYKITEAFPRSEQFGLVQQMRRAAASISSNVAEGAGRGAAQSFRAFVRIARGSLHEVQSQVYLALDLRLITSTAAEPLLSRADRLGRLLSGLLRVEKRP